MTIRTTLSFTDRHHGFLQRKVSEGVFASASAAVASAIERMMEDEIAREAALDAMTDEIRARLATPSDDYLDLDAALAPIREMIAAGERGEPT
ncbi:MAG: type II toxin-antitoxin system ParD family antitoxin [Amaricoccus sp.]|uniref:type II toxin-antitoxin system ParD family antitoxin n=1 Tax=Amaricoccus sp. TaxID=1872485 RepID=UPI0039E3FA7C